MSDCCSVFFSADRPVAAVCNCLQGPHDAATPRVVQGVHLLRSLSPAALLPRGCLCLPERWGDTWGIEGMSWGHFCRTPAAAAAENVSLSWLGCLRDVLWRAGLLGLTRVFYLRKQHRIKFVRNKTL